MKTSHKSNYNKRNDNKNNNLINMHNKGQSNSAYNLISPKKHKFQNINADNKSFTQSKNRSANKNKNKLTKLCISSQKKSIFNNNMIISKKQKNEQEVEKLKMILINKMNNKIEEEIKGKQNIYFNDNNNLFFLGFCDILFELGFLHIKETEIIDITKINEHLNELYTQPFTNKALLSEKFLYNEQKLLVCAWKTILNNFHLIREFNDLPLESEEITLEDFKLFIFIITGLFTGYNESKYNNTANRIFMSNNNLNIKKNSNGGLFKNNSKNENENILGYDINKINIFNNNNNSLTKENKYSFHKKNSNNNNNENILKKILNNKNKYDNNNKNILKIKNYFNYFSELRKLYNLYKKDLRSIQKKINLENELTFYPKTNKNNNKKILNRFGHSLNFFERNAIIKNRSEQKKERLKKERNIELLKECTFKPCKNSRNKSKDKKNSLSSTKQKNPIEISNRLYNNYSKRKKSYTDNNTHTNTSGNLSSTKKMSEDKNSDKKGGLFYKSIMQKKNKIRQLSIYNKKILSNSTNNNFNNSCSKMQNSSNININKMKKNFTPEINKKLNKTMFSYSPLINDELLNKRINKLRDSNFKKFVNNYEQNNREILSDNVKKNKNILKDIINEEKGYMKLDIEKKSNKDTFDNFKNYNYYYNKENLKNKIIKNEPLFIVEIKIKDEVKMIEVYQDDIPEKLAYDFCTENLLGTLSYEKILLIIKSKMEELTNEAYNINENSNLYQNNENELTEEINYNDYNENNIENGEKNKEICDVGEIVNVKNENFENENYIVDNIDNINYNFNLIQ